MSYYGGGAFQALGQGLRGIGRGVADRRHERRELERRDLEDERRREREDRETALRVGELGGGEGPAPTQEFRPNEFGLTGPQEFEPPELFEDPDRTPVGADDILPPPPDFSEHQREPVTLERPDPRFMDVPGGYHVMTPDARARRDFELESEFDDERYQTMQGRVTDERDRFISSLGPGIGRIAAGEVTPGTDPEGFGTHMATGLAENVDLGVFMPPDEWDPDRDATTQRAQWMMERGYGPAGQVLPTPGGEAGGGAPGRPDGFTLRQADAALALLNNASTIQQHIAATDDPDRIAQLEGRLQAMLGASPFNSIEEAASFLRPEELGVNLPEPGAEGEAGGEDGWRVPYRTPEAPLPPNEIESIRNDLSAFPEREWEKILREENATEEQIQQILGGG